ncbi:MAG TPA: DUF255 domain-containing protein [Thermoanaerobaculia bacterium]|nr:DUF255 domain-containing protein [Thermoanaerobaculia bacterium]
MRPGLSVLASAVLALAHSSCGAQAQKQVPAGGVFPAGAPAAVTAAAPAAPASKANRLIRESSPYLLLHAHNPVDWYAWGEEAIDKARREGKPIFLSVGYSTCYWCHVMEREVFSNPDIAAQMNRWFVSIKVDREERPDLDGIYIIATELLNRSAGWPSSLFLTPELKPFFAGTYFPPEDRNGLPGFPRVLEAIHSAWETRRVEVLAKADQVASALREAIAQRQEPAAAAPAASVVEAAVAKLEATYDPVHGGFGGPPKFPSPGTLFLLWEAGDAGARRMVLATLRHMGEGAIYDQVGGGFHRYTLDAAWLTPHFEKMLYDNALLGELLAATAKETGDADLERLARGTLDFILAQMTLPAGAFKSAIDAETDGVEGAYYLWTREEARSVLGEDGYKLLAPIFGLDAAPNFEGGRYTLYLTRPLDDHARRLGILRSELLQRLAPLLEKLGRARAQRKSPLIDDKVLTDWNGMMIAAMARAGQLLAEPRYTQAAMRSARFILAHLKGSSSGETRRVGGSPAGSAAPPTLLHAWRSGEAKIPAFLDDYAFLIRGLLALHEVTRDARWRAEAERLADEMESRLRDPRGGYYNSEAKPNLLIQSRTATDGAIPSGNAIAVLDLVRLGRRAPAEASLRGFAHEIESFPAAMATLADAVFVFHGGQTASAAPQKVAIGSVGPSGAGASPAAAEPPGVGLAKEVVKTAVRLEAAGEEGWRPFVLDLEIRGGWHVNANPTSLDFLIPTQVEGTLRRVAYPAGQRLRFPFAPDEIAVYTGKAAIHGEVGPGERALRLTYQACDEQRCLPPVHTSVPLPGAP